MKLVKIMSSKEIQGYKAIPIVLSKDGTSSHELLVKEHSLRLQESDKPPGRTLFVLNIPPYITDEDMKTLFTSAVKVLTVTQHSNNTNNNGFKTAYIVFAKREGLLKALQASILRLDSPSFKTGLDKWISEYNDSIGNLVDLTKEINTFMLNHDKSEEQKKKNVKDVDNEGWTVVTKKGRRPGLARKESVSIKLNEKISQTSKKKELQNFYTFQIRESKLKNLATLRKNYEDAKKKVTLMKSSRRFKPY